MNILIMVQWIFFIFFFISSIVGINTEDPMLVAIGGILFGVTFFLELIFIKEDIKKLKKRQENENN